MNKKQEEAIMAIKEGLKKLIFNNETETESEVVEVKNEVITEKTDYKLADGVVISSLDSELKEGSEIFMVAEDGAKIPAVAGDYTLEDGRVITVIIDEADGLSKISKISEASEEAPEVETETETEVDMNVELKNKITVLEDEVKKLTEISNKMLEVISEQANDLIKFSKQSVAEVQVVDANKLIPSDNRIQRLMELKNSLNNKK